MMGITHLTLASWRGRPVTKDDVRVLSRAEAAEIYRARYWNAIAGDDLPAGLDLATFDYAVNSGPSRAVQTIQGLVAADVDGRIGPKSLAAIRATDADALIRDLCARDCAFSGTCRPSMCSGGAGPVA